MRTLTPDYKAQIFPLPISNHLFSKHLCAGWDAPERRKLGAVLACGARLQGPAFQRQTASQETRVSDAHSGWRGSRQRACVYMGYVVSPAVLRWRPLCTEPLMDNGWALSPQQMCWGLEPGRAGIRQTRGTKGPEKTRKVTTGGKLKK